MKIPCPEEGCGYSNQGVSFICLHLLYVHRWSRHRVSRWFLDYVAQTMDKTP